MSWDIGLTGEIDGHPVHLGEWNYTHNTTQMIRAAGFEDWGVEVLHGISAADLAPRLRAAVDRMKADPATFRAMNPENGWGSYETLVPVLEDLVSRAEKFPSARVSASF